MGRGNTSDRRYQDFCPFGSRWTFLYLSFLSLRNLGVCEGCLALQFDLLTIHGPYATSMAVDLVANRLPTSVDTLRPFVDVNET
jgi:hypothetical protein